jgi:DNA repair protein RadC
MKLQVQEEWRHKIESPAIFADILRSILSVEDEIDRDKEHFWTIGLNRKNVIKYIDLVSLGTLDQTFAEPREVFRAAVRGGVSAIIIAHNHPSAGEPVVSKDDIRTTTRLRDAGDILGIRVLDHVVVSDVGYWSAVEAGVLR